MLPMTVQYTPFSTPDAKSTSVSLRPIYRFFLSEWNRLTHRPRLVTQVGSVSTSVASKYRWSQKV